MNASRFLLLLIALCSLATLASNKTASRVAVALVIVLCGVGALGWLG